MNLSKLQPDIQMHPDPELKPESSGHAYKWVWGVSIVFLVVAIFLGAVLWKQGRFSTEELNVVELDIKEAEQKMNALEEANARAEFENAQSSSENDMSADEIQE